METELVSETPTSLKNRMKDKVPKKKILSVNFSCALFSLLFIHDDLAMWGLVWLHVAPVQSSLVLRGPVRRFIHQCNTTSRI
jgi:hypothetical protein